MSLADALACESASIIADTVPTRFETAAKEYEFPEGDKDSILSHHLCGRIIWKKKIGHQFCVQERLPRFGLVEHLS